MLRLSKKADYALMAMKHLATHTDAASTSARAIAEEYNIPLELMAKVLQILARAACSHQAARRLHASKAPASISVADIQAIDGPLTVTACSTDDEQCEQFTHCNVRDPLWRIKDRIISALATVSLAEIASEEPLPAEVAHVSFRRTVSS